MLASISIAALLVFAAPHKAPKKTTTPAKSTIAVPTPEPDTLFFAVKAGPSQSLSWIGIRNLGAWTPEIAAQVLKDNPGLNPDSLPVGTTLRLRKILDRHSQTPQQQISMASKKAVVTRFSGNAVRVLPDQSQTPLKSNMFLSTGDVVKTGPGGMVELIIDNQSILRLRENSQLSLVAIQDSGRLAAGSAGTQVALDMGRLWTKVRKWAGPLVGFEVKMPNAIAGVHGTIFECETRRDSTESVVVEEGVVGVRSLRFATPEVRVPQGKTITADSTGRLSEVKESIAPPVKPDLAPDPGESRSFQPETDIRQAGVSANLIKARQAMPTGCKPDDRPGRPGSVACLR